VQIQEQSTGGFIARAGKTQIDASLDSQLEQARSELISGIGKVLFGD
jgi:F0F1-type ATP synthase delta subunit